jgi:hypothetical protein
MTIRVKLKTSNTAGAAPLPADLIEGEIALNINPTSVAAYTKDSAGTVVKLTGTNAINSGVYILPTAPPSPFNGMVWVDTSKTPPEAQVWNGTGSKWEKLCGSSGASRSITPAPADVTASPAFVSGTGTVADPFLLSPSTVSTGGGTASSTQELTISGPVGGQVQFVDLSAGVDGPRFLQVDGVVGPSGKWTGKLTYLDAPESTANTPYTANFQIGTVYFRWVVAQKVLPRLVADVATTIAGGAEIGSVLTATPGTAKDGTPPITYATRWQVSADGTSGWVDIAAAVGSTYTIQSTDLNKYLRAVTKATDSLAQTLELPSGASAKVKQVPIAYFSWDSETDIYTRELVADRHIEVHACIRRCLLTDAGGVTYLDADDSTMLAGDWLRLCETTELDTPYTGTHGAEVANTALRDGVPAWTAGTYTKGQRVIYGGSVWECLAAATAETPAAGSSAADLSGATAQVMVEIPRFSVWHEVTPSGSNSLHKFHVVGGTKTTGGFAVHPAFVKPDGSYRDFFYTGAYHITGTTKNGSASKTSNVTNLKRSDYRTACAARGAGWHQLSYWEYSALQWLLITEYQDMNSQKVTGKGGAAGSSHRNLTGESDVRGNRCINYFVPPRPSLYMSYRGIENIYGKAWQYVDGFNADDGTHIYLCNDPAKWADDTTANYTAAGTVPSMSGSYQRDLMSGIALLPLSATGASKNTFIGDTLWGISGWRVGCVGGNTDYPDQSGIFCLSTTYGFDSPSDARGSRLSYAA